MGCVCGKNKKKSLIAEELVLSSLEEELGYYKHKVIDSYSIIRRNSDNGKINPNQWAVIVEELKIQVRRMTNCVYINEFYESMLEQDCFWLKDVLILAILLGNGSSGEKGRLFYRVYDVGDGNIINEEFLKCLFKDICKVFIFSTHVLAGNTAFSGLKSIDSIESYINSLNIRSKYASNGFVKLFCKEKQIITHTDFINVCERKKNSQIFTSHGFRTFVARTTFAIDQEF